MIYNIYIYLILILTYMDINSDNDDSKDNNRDSSISHNNINNNNNTNDDTSSYHMYTFTPIECFVINKHLPFTFKLELEDVYKAYLCKKQKQNEMIMSTYNNSCGTGNVSVNGVCDNRKRKLKRKRKRKKDVEIDNESFDLSESSNNNNNYNYYYAHKKFPPLNRKVTKKMKISNQLKCEKVVYKLQRIPMSKYFFTACSVDNYLISRNMLPKKKITKNRKGAYNSNNTVNGSSSSVFHYLKKIYMKVQNKEYETIYHFGNDLRRTWDGLFRLYGNNPKLYTKIYTLSEKCEEWMNRMEGVSYSKLKKDDELSSEDELCDIYSNNNNNSCCYYDAVSNSNNINNTHYKFITHNVVDDVAAQQQHHQMYNNNKRQLLHNNNNNTLFRTTTCYQQQQQRTLFNVNDSKPRQQRLPVKPPTQEEKDFINTGIKHLSKDQLYEILKIIGGSVKQNNTGIYKFNIEDLEISEQRELYNYVSRCLHQQQHNNNSIQQRDITQTHEHNPERERLTDIDKVEQLKKDLGFYHSYNRYSTEIDNTYNLPKYDSYINNINTLNNNNNSIY